MDKPKWDTARLSTGERSFLKRNAGRAFGEDLRAVEAFYRAVGYVPKSEEQQERWFACLCMESLWRTENKVASVPFEELLRRMYQNKDVSESMKRRIVALLDIPWSCDGFLLGKLGNFARKMRNENAAVMPDFSRLADDLRYWNNQERRVQRRWIRTICDNAKTDETESEESNHVD